MLRRMFTDARFGLRLLRRSPAFGVTLLAILVLGIGATTAMFSLVLSLLLRPLPYPHPEALTMVWTTQPGYTTTAASLRDFQDWREQGSTFSAMAATSSIGFSLSSAGAADAAPEYAPGANVSGDFFSVFGLAPLRGRLLGPDDDRLGAPRVAVISAAVWHRRFASDPAIVGKTLVLSGEPYTVVGVAPEGFKFSGPNTNRCEVWVPLAVGLGIYAESLKDDARGSHFLSVMGRRRDGVSIEQAQAELDGVAKSLAEKYPESNTKVGVRLIDLHEQLVGSSREGIWVLFAAIGLVFLVVCANVANLLLARAASRRGELAARVALGATRERLVGQLLTETATIFVLAACLGTGLAYVLVDVFAARVVQGAGALTIDTRVDAGALAFAVATSLLCGLAFGVAPALEASRVSPQAILKESGSRASIGRRQRLVRGGLVVAQVALAFTLLVGAGLALGAFDKVASTPIGFDPKNVVTGRFELPRVKYATDEQKVAFYRETFARIAQEPGVVSVTSNSMLPLSGASSDSTFAIEGRPRWPAGERPTLQFNIVTPGYFRTMGTTILRGRDFDDADVASGRKVMILSQAAAKRFFPGDDPIGHRIDLANSDDKPEWAEIVGIAADVRRFGPMRPVFPEAFLPFAQHPWASTVIAVRTTQPEALMKAFPRIIASIDAEQAVFAVRSMDALFDASVGSQRFVAVLLGAFAAAALVLATIGIFGLVSYTTSHRTRELGIRVALGAPPRDVVSVVMRDGLRLLGWGLAVGLVGALLVGRALSGRVSGALPFDPVVIAVIVAVLATAGTLASLLPALRAVRIPPAAALRYE